MNWIGGRLQQHSKSKSNKSIRFQKQHFAKARLQSQTKLFSTQSGQLSTGHQQKQPLKFDDLDQSIARAENVTTGIYSSDTSEYQSNFQDRRPGSGADSEVLQENYQPIFASNLDTKHLTHDSNSFENIRKTLLRRSDWLGVSAARPLKIPFASGQSDERIGRPRRLDLRAEEQAIPQEYTRGQQRFNEDNLPWRSTSIGTWSGLDVHQAQRTIDSSPQQGRPKRLRTPSVLLSSRDVIGQDDNAHSISSDRYEKHSSLTDSENYNLDFRMASITQKFSSDEDRSRSLPSWQHSKKTSSYHHVTNGSIFEPNYRATPTSRIEPSTSDIINEAQGEQLYCDQRYMESAKRKSSLSHMTKLFSSEVSSSSKRSTAPASCLTYTTKKLPGKARRENLACFGDDNDYSPSLEVDISNDADKAWTKYVFSDSLSQSWKHLRTPVGSEYLHNDMKYSDVNTKPFFRENYLCNSSFRKGLRVDENTRESILVDDNCGIKSGITTVQDHGLLSVKASPETDNLSQLSSTKDTSNRISIKLRACNDTARSYDQFPKVSCSEHSLSSQIVGQNRIKRGKRTAEDAFPHEWDYTATQASSATPMTYDQSSMQLENPTVGVGTRILRYPRIHKMTFLR